MEWTRINGSLTITKRQRSGYEYRIRKRKDGSALLIAESEPGNRLPIRRLNCDDILHGVLLAEQIEDEENRNRRVGI